MASLLVLWDVDFTLVDTHGVGKHLYQLAFAELYGKDLPDLANEARMAGRTDRAIVLEVLERAGLADPRGQLDRFEAALTRLAPSVTALVAASGTVLPGAREALAAIAELADAAPSGSWPVRQTLLTGNVRALAMAKLSPLGLTKYLDVDIGAYGDESERRADLVELARTRAAQANHADFSGQATVVVGDTPLDVQAALAHGARAVGVATGQYTQDELAASGADAVLADLADTSKVLAALVHADAVAVRPRPERGYQPRPA